ncbi:MAG TPA: hypothetical protein VF507_01010, partial [Pyrinomonadaceae bacterium]
MKILIPLFVLVLLMTGFVLGQQGARPSSGSSQQQPQSLALAAEKHLRNVRQLTFGGENAEAYFSGDGKQLIFQSKRDGRACDQIYTMRTDGSGVRMVSTGGGATTCSYLFPSGGRILYASTH